ncbi:MAG: signal peptidase I [Candidatus Zambryskibacteria bacterium RIFCSPHIGHO2_01_FULL_46_30]|uniref:Signal peptidase I n=1 Tax=Candidatus Zambryskibacteria bacterium RIFCSPHIGHO2_01_FULL_46_30 TaxID=1802739 RepID=A0A1G2SYW1_9BACT|nr:MAG: signal peptidase I [Candidatus Zambryskibacteria bacterium RIFCSPHIGHO2_01_FULL_46_30]OHB05608.1 MAG: signal peptidase I [Candidatus Zambryskibacteria bacterium RIFCSPLOWO2_01_FULL_47_33]
MSFGKFYATSRGVEEPKLKLDVRQMKAPSKIGYWIFVTAVVLLGLLLITSLFPVSGNIQVKIVQSGSMEPAIKTGAMVVIRPSSEYRIGDVIMFGKDTKTEVPTTHRIVADEVRSGVFYYTTQGDANEDPDPQQVAQSEVIGKVLFSISYLGYVLDFAKKPLGFALLIGVPAVIVVFDEGTNIWRETKRLRKKNILNGENQNES